MHRPGIARVVGDTIILDGTTMHELEEHHARTLRLCVERVNDQEAEYLERMRAQQQRADDERQRHQQEIDEIADRLRFDDEDEGG